MAGQQPAPTRAVFRSADDLYSQLPVRDVVRVLAKTKEDAEKKREELRDLVGRRYHDLIDSADAIISMNDTVVGFEKMLLTIEAAASSLLNDQSKTLKSTSASSVKRKQAEAMETVWKPSTEREKIEFLLRAPTEIWSALEQGNERKSAQILEAARGTAAELKIISLPPSEYEAKASDELLEAADELALTESRLAACRYLIGKAHEDRAMGGEWFSKFPFLVSQVKLLDNCKQDIISSASSAFAERQISAERVERAVEALLLVGEISNPLKSLLDARTNAIRNLVGGDEDSLFAIAELTARTVKDCAWLKTKFQKPAAEQEVRAWLEQVARPTARGIVESVCARTTSVFSLVSLQNSLQETMKKVDADEASSASNGFVTDDVLFQTLFGEVFSSRAANLMAQSFETLLRKVKKILSAANSATDDKKNIAAEKAFATLEKGLISVDKDAAEIRDDSSLDSSASSNSPAWLNDLLSWLDQRPTPTIARFCDILSLYLREKNISGGNKTVVKLGEISKRAMDAWSDALIKRLGDDLEVRLPGLPWFKEGRATSSQLGGWTADTAHGDLPSVPSWPVAEFVFHVTRELDAATDALHRGGSVCDETDIRLRKHVGELAFRRIHSIYSTLAKEATGPDGKLQAAFDLEFCTASLLDVTRPPLPFTSGGIDVYACGDALRLRARSFAAASRLLHSSLKPQENTTESVHETKVGGHALLTVVEPVPRFALLPVPQKRASPRLLHRSSSQNSGSSLQEHGTSTSTGPSRASTASGIAGVGLGRVLGWLS